MVRAGAARSELAEVLSSAYGDGLLSDRTLAHRLELLFSALLVEPRQVVGDLAICSPRARTMPALLRRFLATRGERARERSAQAALLLSLDWSGAQDDLVLGRHAGCDVVLLGPFVSRRHARLCFRSGAWIVQDLDSTNGTRVNGDAVARRRLSPGDLLTIGTHRLRVD